MFSRNQVRSVAVLLGVGQLLAGCGSGLEEAQETGAVAQELSSSCTSSAVSLVQPDGKAVAFQYPNCSIADSAADSVDATYDQELCPNRFVTEVQGVNNRSFTAFVELLPANGTQFTQSSCEGQVISGTAWGYAGTAWTELGSVSSAGIWHPASCGELLCLPATCQVRFNIASASGYSKVRVAGSAAALGLFKGRVRTGVRAGPGPC